MSKKSIVVIGLIIVMLVGVLMDQSPLEIRAAASSPVAGWQQMSSPGGEAVWVSPTSRLTGADIERAEVRTQNGQPAVGVVFTAEGEKKMIALSAEQTNRPVALLLDGKLIWAPIVRGSIGSEAVLTGGPDGLTPAQIERLLTTFKAK